MSQTPAKSFAPSSPFGGSNVNVSAGPAQAAGAAPTLAYAPGMYPGSGQPTQPQQASAAPQQAVQQPMDPASRQLGMQPGLRSAFYGNQPINRALNF
jgi:hypothetical protein